MTRTGQFIAALLALLLTAAAPAAAQSLEDRPDYPETPLAVVTDDGTRHDFTVELARTPEERGFGLMFVRKLAPDRGMLFDYRRDTRASMWMKNTYIPLDMLFIESDGEIESIIERALPHTLESRSAKGRVRAVLELKGGIVERLGIAPGDRVVHPIFQGDKDES